MLAVSKGHTILTKLEIGRQNKFRRRASFTGTKFGGGKALLRLSASDGQASEGEAESYLPARQGFRSGFGARFQNLTNLTSRFLDVSITHSR
jgi:hypothetical protein